MLYLGVDIGGTAVKVGLVTEHGKVLSNASYDAAFDDYKTPLLQTALKSAVLFLQKQNQPVEELQGIGISATGQIDVFQKKVIGTAGHIKNWIGSEIGKAFADTFHKPVAVENDANCVAIAEHWNGCARDCENMIVITLGTGVGGGVIVHSNLLTGSMGIAGELGHIPLDLSGPICNCGNRGCYELYASTRALIRQVADVLPTLGLPASVTAQSLSGQVIFDLLDGEYPRLQAVVDRWISAVAAGLIGLTHIFNPELILIGGGVSTQETQFIAKVREAVLTGVMPRFADHLRVEAACLGNLAGLIGAVRCAVLEQEERERKE